VTAESYNGCSGYTQFGSAGVRQIHNVLQYMTMVYYETHDDVDVVTCHYNFSDVNHASTPDIIQN